MDSPNKKLSEIVEKVKSWVPRRTEPANLSRDFWMPDQSCRVCYECDSQFTVFNRRHHCRLCGRVFCAKCTANSIPISSDEPNTGREEWERIRVCIYCFKQWEQEVSTVENGASTSIECLSPSPSTTSLASANSSTSNINSTTGSVPFSTGPYQQLAYSSAVSLSPRPSQSEQMETGVSKQEIVATGTGRSVGPMAEMGDPSPNSFKFFMNRSDDEDNECGAYRSDSEIRDFIQPDYYYDQVKCDEINQSYGILKEHPSNADIYAKDMDSSPMHESLDSLGLEGDKKQGDEVDGRDNGVVHDGLEGRDADPVDFENNGLLWLPPEPKDEEDEQEGLLFDDDDDEGTTREWGNLRSLSSFGNEEYHSMDRSSEEHKKVMKNVVDGHFRALVSQLLQVENLPVGEEDNEESWLEIITSLSWEAATLLKPDTSAGGGMDPGGYVKIKCIACGRRSASMVVKGVVCKKNVAHRRMTSKLEKPRFLILGGALEYQRVSNLLSSFDTLLQQEMDHLKMAVAKIAAHHPNVLLVEKSVSRFAQEYLLEKDISLVLNIKRPLLERIARCTGAQIVPSIDYLSSQKLGYCDTFHVEKFLEEHGTAGQGGKKMVKTLMFFQGCPKPLGCTILLKGAKGDELKKVKHVLQYGVFAAYHLALETSFLADEGASLPELPLKTPITVALPNKPSSMDRSISTIPGFTVPSSGKPQEPESGTEAQNPSTILTSESKSPTQSQGLSRTEMEVPTSLSKFPSSQYTSSASSFGNSYASNLYLSPTERFAYGCSDNKLSAYSPYEKKHKADFGDSIKNKTFVANNDEVSVGDHLVSSCFGALEASSQGQGVSNEANTKHDAMIVNHFGESGMPSLQPDTNKYPNEQGSSKEEFPPSPSDHHSILVSLSTRCVWKGTVCERAHLFRIKYYGSFDRPLGRFLRDHLFDRSYCCLSCEMPSEAHVHCYTHRHGSLTISVKKFAEFLLPGEREGKIWMWHRCLLCPRTNGFPPATRRIVMSDAAWGLSFGKFLELSFSNHAAASRVASCGHSLHRDCLRFYGFGRMVACFRYASIDVNSVYLPPAKLDFDFDYDNQAWIQNEVNEVLSRVELLFTEVSKPLRQFAETRSVTGSLKVAESSLHIAELEEMLQKEKSEFQESLHKATTKEVEKGQLVVDILEIGRIRRQLLILSYMWDQRLIHAASLNSKNLQERVGSTFPKHIEEPSNYVEKPVDITSDLKQDRPIANCDSHLVNASDQNLKQGNKHEKPRLTFQGIEQDSNSNQGREFVPHKTTSMDVGDKIDPLDSGIVVRRAVSEGQFPIVANLSDTLDAAWTGENQPVIRTPKENSATIADTPNIVEAVSVKLELEENLADPRTAEKTHSLRHSSSSKMADNIEDSRGWSAMPFLKFYRSLNKIYSGTTSNLDMLGDYNPVYVSSYWEMERQGGARLLLPVGVNDIVVPIYDNEPTSIISYTLLSADYHAQMSDEWERPKDGMESSVSLPYDTPHLFSLHSFDDMTLESFKSMGSTEDGILSMSSSRSSLVSNPLLYTKALHVRVSFTDDGPLGKVKYTVTCYYAKRFEALRKTCCPSEIDFIRSLSRCRKWRAQGGKSNAFFAKTMDDRFIVKQVTKTELESFIKFGPEYFKYLSESVGTGCSTCLAKIVGIYQVTSKYLKGGKETKMDVLVMENLLFGRNLIRLYDLKGSARSRYNPDSSGSNKVLLDQNLIEAMPTSPIFVGNKDKRLLERAVWNDTSFLASIDVMDYSLLVGVDNEKNELVIGIIDFMRQYTWDKHLETWVKASGILGGPKNVSPTVVSPKQYKKRFRKAMSAYFLMVPDSWSPPAFNPSASPSDICEESDTAR